MGKINVGDFFKKYTMIIALILVIIFFNWKTSGAILLPQNLNNLLSQNAYVFVLSAGMLLCILTGGNIDLAVGSVLCFAGGIGAVMMDKGMNPWISFLAMLAIGLLVGVWQGFWIAYVNVPPFIATLAGMYAFRGLSNVVLGGQVVSVENETFVNWFGGGADCYVKDFLGASSGSTVNITCLVAFAICAIIFVIMQIAGRLNSIRRGYETQPLASQIIKMICICAAIFFVGFKLANYKGIPTSFIWVAIVLLSYGYLTSRTVIGRYLYAVGGNKKSARLSGINTKYVLFFAYINMGLMAGLAGVLTIARMTSAQPTYGQGYEMDAIGACFIGGASATGGVGTVPGVLIGALLMGVINQGMSIMGINANYQKVVKGVVLLVAILFDVLSKKEKK